MDAMLPSQAMSATALLPLLTAKLRGEFAPLLQTLMQHGTYLSHTYALELIFTLVRFDAALQPAERAVFVHVFDVIVKHLVDEVRQCGRLRRQLHELQAMLRGMLSRCAALQELYDVVSSAATPQTQQRQQTVVTPSATHVDVMLAVSDDRYGVTHGAGGMASGALGGSSLANNNSMDIPVSLRNSPLQSTLVCELASSVPLSQNSSMANVPAAQLQRCNSVQRLVHGNFRRRVNRSLLGMPTESQSSLAIAPTQPDLTLATSVESVSERVEEAQRPRSPMKDALMQSWEQVFWALLSGELPRADGQLLLFLLSQPESKATSLPTTSGSPGAVKSSSVPGATTTTTTTGAHDALGPSRVVNHSMTSNSTSGGMVGAQMTSSAATRAEQERRRTSPSTQRQRQRVVTEALKAMELQPDMLQSELWGGLHSALLVLVDCFLIGAEDQRPSVASPKAAEEEQTQPGAFTAGRNGTETRYGGRPSTGRSVRQAPPRPLTPGDRAVTSMFMINDQPRTLPRSASFPYMPPAYNNNAAEETDVTDGENGLSGAGTNDEMSRPVPLEEVPLASADALALLRLLCPALHNYSGAIETLLTTAAPSLASRATSGRGLTTSSVTGESIVEDEEDEASALLRQATVQPLRAVDVLLHVFLAALAWQYMSSTTASHIPATVRPRVAETVPSVASFSSFQPTPVPPAAALPWQTAMAVGGGGGSSANGSFAMDPSSTAGPRRGQAAMGDDPSPLVPTSFNYSFASAATTMTAAAPQTASPTALLQGRLRGLLEHTRRAVNQRTTGATQTGEESSGHDTAAPRPRSVLDVMGDVLRSMLSEVEDGLVAVAKMEAQARGEATLVIFRVVSTVLDWLIPTVHVVDRRMCIFYRRWICELYRLLYDNDLLERFTCILNQNVHDTGDEPAEECDSGAMTTAATTEAPNQASEATRRLPLTSEPTRRAPHGRAGGQALTASASETETGSATSTGTRSPTQRTATTTTGSGGHVRLSAPKTAAKEHDNKAGSGATTTQAHHKMTSHARPHRDTPPMSHQTTTKPRTARLEVQKAQKESRGDSSVERSSKTSLSRHGSSSNDGGRMTCSTGGVEEESATVSQAKAATQENTKPSTTTNDSVAVRQSGGLPTSGDTLYDLLVPGCGLQRVGSASSIAAVQLYNRQRAAMGSAVHAARLLLNHGTIVPPPRHYILSRIIAATVRGLDKEAVRSILAIFAVPEENGTSSLTRPPATLPTNDIALSSSSTSSSASSSSTSSSSSSPVRRNDNNPTDQHGLSTAAPSLGRTQHKASSKAAGHAHRQNVKARGAVVAAHKTSNTPSEAFTTMTSSSSRTRPLHQSPSPAVAAASTLGPNLSRRAAQRVARNANGTSSAASPLAITTTTTTTGGNTVMSSNTNKSNNNAVVVAGEGTPALLHHHRFRYPAVTQQADLAALYHHTLQDAELLLSPHDPIRAGLVRAVVDYYANDMHDIEGALQILDNYLSDVNEERVQLPYTRPVVLGLSGDEAAYAAAPSAALGENSNSELGHGARHAANALQGHAAITTAPSSPLGSWNGHISASDAATLSSAQASEVFYSASHELRQSAVGQSGTMTANAAALNSGGEGMDGAPVVPLVIPSWTTAEEQAEFTCILRDLRTMQLALQSSS